MSATPEVSTAAPPASPAPRSGRLWVFLLPTLALAVLAGLFLLGWLPRIAKQAELAAETQRSALGPPRVRVAKPKLAPATTATTLPGSIVAAQEAVVYSRSSGYVKRWLVDLGDKAETGQVLVEIDAPDAAQMLAQAQGTLAQSNATVEQTKASLLLAKLSLERLKTLGPTLTPQQDIDTKQGDYDVAAANLKVAEAKVLADTADVRRFELLKSFSKVLAPFSGTITKRWIEVGDLIAGGAGASAQPLFRIARTDPVRVLVDVPQTLAPVIEVGIEARVTQQGTAAVPATGKVAHIAHALDPASRTMRVEVEVPNPDGKLLPGSYAQVAFSVPNVKPLLVINAAALIISGNGVQVAVVDQQNRVHFSAVVIEIDSGAELSISSGLKAEDRVIVNPAGSLVEGGVVEIVLPEPPPASPASPAPKPNP